MFFLSLEILTLLILSTSGFVGVSEFGFGDVVSGGLSSSDNGGAAGVTMFCSVFASQNRTVILVGPSLALERDLVGQWSVGTVTF